MAITVRYLVISPGASGLPRYYWQPSSKLRKQGWRPQRVPLHWQDFTDPGALLAAAIARAQELNAELDDRVAAKVPEMTTPARRTLGALILAYKTNDDYLRLAKKTQRDYRYCLDRLETWAGDTPVTAISAERVNRLYVALGRTAMAAAVVRVLRLLLEHGRRANWLSINPAVRPKLRKRAPGGLIWPPEAVDAFVAAADGMGRHSIGTAILLNVWLGQREDDILRLPRAALRNGTLLIRQQKRGAGVALPVHLVTPVVRRLEEEAARVKAAVGDGVVPLTFIVSEETGRPYKVDNFCHVFARVRAAVAKAHPKGFPVDHLMPGRDSTAPNAFTIFAEELTFRLLRHTAVTRFGEAECDTSLIATISGHSHATVVQIIERYMVRTSKMATLAFGRRLAAEGMETPAAETVRGAG